MAGRERLLLHVWEGEVVIAWPGGRLSLHGREGGCHYMAGREGCNYIAGREVVIKRLEGRLSLKLHGW